MKMSLTNFILTTTFLDLSVIMNKIFVSNKIQNIVLYYQNHSLDAASEVIASSNAFERTISIFEYDENNAEMKRHSKYTFFIYLLNMPALFSIFSELEWIPEANSECRRLLIMDDRHGSNNNLLDFPFWELWNMALIIRSATELYLCSFNFNDFSLTTFNESYVNESNDLYNDIFVDDMFLLKPINFSIIFYPFWFPPNEIKLLSRNETASYYIGKTMYLVELICNQFGVAMIPIYSSGYFYEMNKSYKDYMKTYVVVPAPTDPNDRDPVFLGINIAHMELEFEVYPFDEDSLVILVPNILDFSSLLAQLIVESPLLTVWSITILLITSIRLCLQTNCMHWPSNISRIALDTFSIAFTGSGFVSITKRSERTIILSLSIFSFLSSIICTGYIFQQYTSQVIHHGINSIEDLNNSKFEIHGSDVYINEDCFKFLKQL